MERRKKWSFFIIANGEWVWRVLHPDGTERCSEKSFVTLQDCTADATQHGYVVWDPAKERRRNP